jgi:hypothetical protein
MQTLKEYYENSFIKKHGKIIRVVSFMIVILIVILANMYWNRLNKNENNFLKGLDLSLTLKVITVVPTGNHGYGVILGKVINSNKSENYSAVYQNKYTFCKIIHGKVLLVSDYYVFVKNDSVIINSKIAKYWVYRKGKLVSEYNLTNTTDDFLYGDLEKNKYLDFSTYENHR